MITLFRRLLAAFICLVCYESVVFSQAPDAIAILDKVLNATRAYKTLHYSLEIRERMNGSITKQISTTKVNRFPFKTYIHQDFPKKGLEVLWVEGWNDNQAYINTNGFPWVNVSLDPKGSTMRENTHHTLFNSGFSYFGDILSHLKNKYKDRLTALIKLDGTEVMNGKECFRLQLSNPDFKIIEYTGKPGETPTSYAEKNYISEHMILELNPSITDYNQSIAGKTIKVPNDYAARMTVLVDKKTFLPVQTTVYDLKGLYEEYRYSMVIINPAFKPEEFTPDYPEYKF